MMKRLVILFLPMLLAACAQELKSVWPITGTVYSRENAALPSDAQLIVRLEDSSHGQGEATPVARAVVMRPALSGTIYELAYDPTSIDPSRRYMLWAQIVAGGQVLFESVQPQPILTLGAPDYGDIRIQSGSGRRAAQAQTPTASPPSVPPANSAAETMPSIPQSAPTPAQTPTPAPQPTPAATPRDAEFENKFGKAARYACVDGSILIAWFEQGGAYVDIERLGREAVRLGRRADEGSFAFRDRNGQFTLSGRGNEIIWRQPAQAELACRVTADRVPLRLSPGPFPSTQIANRTDWARRLYDYWPAVQLCTKMDVDALPRVTVAYALNNNRVATRLVYGDGSRAECISDVNARSLPTITPMRGDVQPVTGEGQVLFTPVEGAYPEGACYRTERVFDRGGEFIGWLSSWTCGAQPRG